MKTDEKKTFFSELLEEPGNSLLDQAIERGKIPIGYTCSLVPDVLLSVDRLVPVRVRAPGVAGTEIADTYLSSVICSYTRSILEHALDGRYDFIRGWVFAASCDHLRRLHDNLGYLKSPAFSHMLDVPHKATEEGIRWLADEISMLAGRLSEHFGVAMDDEAISAAIARRNEFITILVALGDLRKNERPPISGAEFHTVMMAVQSAPEEMVRPAVVSLLERMQERPVIEPRARLMVAGGNLDDPAFIGAIESQGALVVADRFCTGSIPGLVPIAAASDPAAALAAHVFAKTRCPRMMEDFDCRVRTIIETAREYRVDGVIVEIIKFCDTWGVESSALVSALREHGLPVLKLEREYRLTGEGQLKTRVQAFIESMGK